MHYGTYDAPDAARPWTTWLRYHAAAMIYACLYALLFAVAYQLFYHYPALINSAIGLVADNKPANAFLNDLGKDMKLVSTILPLILLTWAVEKYRKATEVDRKLRSFFQHLGAIPGAVSQTIRKLKKYELEANADECPENITADMKAEILLPMLQNDRQSLEHLYLRACHLFHQIDNWNNIDSEFFQFKAAYPQAIENIKTRFKKLSRNAKRYYQLKCKFSPEPPLSDRETGDAAMTGFDHMYPKVITELRKDLKNDLKGILNNIYIFIACAVHSKGITARQRSLLLTSFGFKIDDTDTLKTKRIDPNALALLGLFLVFVIPLAAVLASIAGDPKIGNVSSLTYVAWSAMAVFVGLVSVAVPIVVSQAMESSRNIFWQSIRPSGGRPWCSYLLAGIIAGAIGVVGMSLLNYLDPDRISRTLGSTLARMTPWGLIPLSIALTLGYHLDRKTDNGKHTRLIEAATIMLFSVLAAILAVIISSGNADVQKLIPKMYFSVTAAALLGGLTGAIIPNRYRWQIRTAAKVTVEEINLSEVIESCRERFEERAIRDSISITTRIDPSLPNLKADREMINNALVGMLSNSLEYTPRKGKIEICSGLNENRGVTLSVKDNGIGMSSYKKNTILSASDDLLSSAWEGITDSVNTDLLQIRSIAEKHGGRFDLVSRRWEGTEVIVELPAGLVVPKKSGDRWDATGLGPMAVATA
jgi:hypothetical protein